MSNKMTSGLALRSAAGTSPTDLTLPTTLIRGHTASKSFPNPQRTCSLSSTRRIRIGVLGRVIELVGANLRFGYGYRSVTERTIQTPAAPSVRRTDRFL